MGKINEFCAGIDVGKDFFSAVTAVLLERVATQFSRTGPNRRLTFNYRRDILIG